MSNIAAVAYRQAIRFSNPVSFSKISERFNEWNSKRKTSAELQRLSDHQLQDIGLCRADINMIAEELARNNYNR